MRTGILTLDMNDLFLNYLPIRRDILFFDKILIDQRMLEMMMELGGLTIKLNKSEEIKHYLKYNSSFLLLLQREGILISQDFSKKLEVQKIVEINGLNNVKELFNDHMIATEFLDERLHSPKKNVDFNMVEFVRNLNQASYTYSRIFYLSKLANSEFDYIPIMSNPKLYEPQNVFDKQYVFRYILKEIPEPALDVPIEKLFEFRHDLDTKEKYYNLVSWINSVSQKEITNSEFEDIYYSLYYSYLAQFKLHKVEYKSSTFEILVNGVAEFFENALKLQFSKLSNSLFKLGKANVEMITSELNIKNRELAYIVKANENFRKI
jgi:hypothetical protein